VLEVLQALLIAGFVAWATCLLMVLWVRHRVRRTLRVDPTVRTTAPTCWLLAPTTGARLHRRLRATAASARLARDADAALGPLADDLVAEALALEPRIVSLAGTRRGGAPLRRDLSHRVAELESVARGLAALSCTAPSASSRLHERLTALEAAHRELAEIDLRAGLLRHS
jgi:hypothetical protein